MTLNGARVLYISYNGMLDPLGQSQVIPYLKQLNQRGVEFTLLSFERPEALAQHDAEIERMRSDLAASGIDWHWLRYHKTPSLPATSYDVFAGIRYGRRLMREKKIDLIHARNHIAAVIALRLKQRSGAKFIFDVRGLMADEYVDAEHWQKDSLPYRITKSAERRALGAAEGIVTLTKRIWPIMTEWPVLQNREVIHEVVPCCADLDLFRFNEDERRRRRSELGFGNRFVIVYSGSIDGWYLTEKMADLFVAVQQQRSDAHFLWLTPSKHDRIRELMRARGSNDEQYTVVAAIPREVASYLSAADAGLAFIKPCFSKLASSPTKYAEYLGCGLPLLINAGVGDSDALITGEEVGALVADFNPDEYTRAWKQIAQLTANPEGMRLRAREVAQRLFDVRGVGLERYARLYEQVLSG
ncbi:MAG TPA: glycosyltransferase [Pyrinomonadaceae bacterium]|nr:glycosyltransferase [Pyrinomonadaceae bacterium]